MIVVAEDEGHGDEEHHPVLVQGQDDDHDEEVEVGLDQPVREVDERGRGQEQAERHEHRAELGRQRSQRRRHREHGRARRVDDAVPEAVAGDDRRVGRQEHDVAPEEGEQDAMAPPPLLHG
jgi:hypothetical protein